MLPYLLFGFVLVCAFFIYIVYLKKKQIHEKFTNQSLEYPNSDFDIQNPLIKIVKKLGVLSTYLLNPTVWSDAYSLSKMNAVDLARLQIAKDKKQQEK